jgi:hypothetical protein
MLSNLGVSTDDPDDLRLKKNLLVASSLLIGILALLRSVLYLSFGKPPGYLHAASIFRPAERQGLPFAARGTGKIGAPIVQCGAPRDCSGSQGATTTWQPAVSLVPSQIMLNGWLGWPLKYKIMWNPVQLLMGIRFVFELIRNNFRCRRRGTVTVKGKGSRETWFLEGTR